MEEGKMFVFSDGEWKEEAEEKEEKTVEDSIPNADDVVNEALRKAGLLSVNPTEETQKEIARSAEEVLKNKTIEITADAERKAKEAYFKNNMSACECFGYNETSTEKWAVTAMSVWHNIVTALWIVIGMLTFAPVTFIVRKLSVIVKTAWIAVVLAIGIYVFVAFSPFWIKLLASISGNLG